MGDGLILYLRDISQKVNVSVRLEIELAQVKLQ